MECPLSSIVLFIFLQGGDYLHAGNFNTALRYYELEAKISARPDVYYNFGICALAQGKIEQAITCFYRVMNNKPEALFYLGVAYYRLGKLDSAACYFDKLKEKDITSIKYYLGLINLKSGKISEAKRYFDSLSEPELRTGLIQYADDLGYLQRARQKFIQGDYKKALELYDKVKGFPGYRRLGRAMTLIELHQYKLARRFLDSVIKVNNDSLLYFSGLLEAGRLYYRIKNFKRAKQYLKKYLEHRTGNTANFLMGKILSDEQRYREAVRYFRVLPDSVDAFLFYKGRTDYFLGFWGRAEEELMRHYELFPDSKYADRVIYIIAAINFKRKEYRSAIDFWQELIKNFPKSDYVKAAKIGIGDAYYNMKEYRRALSFFLDAQKEKKFLKQDPELNLKIYETKYRLGYYRSIVEALRRYLRDYPATSLAHKVHLRIARIFFNQRNYYQSLSEIETILREHPSAMIRDDALFQKVRICRAIDDKEGLKHTLKDLLQNKGNQEYYLYAVNELAGIFRDEMKYDSSLYYYNILLDSDKYQEKAIMDIAHIYEILSRTDEAETMVDRLIKEFPESVFIVDAYRLKSRLYEKKGDYDKAIGILKELLKTEGERAEVYIDIGNIYFQNEDYVNARKNYLRACEHYRQKRDEAARALILAGDASNALGEKEEAKKFYLRANLIAESPVFKNKAIMKIGRIGEQ